jgi:hypothetical protein
MDSESLDIAVSELGLSKPDLASLLGVTTRAVNLWFAGDRDIPGPVAAYVRLLLSLPKALRAQELARIRKDQQMIHEGMYGIDFTGKTGSGVCALVLMGGCVFGHDGGVLYDGTYEPNASDSQYTDLRLNLTVPAGVELVQGVPAQPAEYRFELNVSIPAGKQSKRIIATPYGPVQCTISYLRPLPARFAA